MTDLELGPVKEALRLTGRTPARHAGVVRAIRRLLWPFIRPYHFVALEWTRDRIAELERSGPGKSGGVAPDLEARLAAETTRQQAMLAEIEARIDARISTRVNAEMVNAGFRQATLRADVIAVGRQLDEWRSRVERVETALAVARDAAGAGERVAAVEQSTAALRDELAHTSQTLSNLAAHTRDLAGMIGQYGEAMRATEARMTDASERHRASVALRLQQIEHRLARGAPPNGESASGASASVAFGGADAAPTPFDSLGAGSFALGQATFYESQFGPLIMRPGDLITRHVLEHGSWDAHMFDVIRQGARRGRVAVDAGAHFGVVSCWMATLFDTVHAFEANRETYVFLCANAALREAGRIRPHNLALWSEPTTLSLANLDEQDIRIATDRPLEDAFRAADNVGSFSFAPDGTGVNAIEARTIDEFNLQDVGFIKVDCQGADGHVIRGAHETIARCRPILVFEWESLLSAPRGITLEQVSSELGAIGYDVKPLYQHNEKQVDYVATPRDRPS